MPDSRFTSKKKNDFNQKQHFPLYKKCFDVTIIFTNKLLYNYIFSTQVHHHLKIVPVVRKERTFQDQRPKVNTRRDKDVDDRLTRYPDTREILTYEQSTKDEIKYRCTFLFCKCILKFIIKKCITVMILSFRTDRPGQTVQTQIRLLIRVYTVCHSVCIVWTH